MGEQDIDNNFIINKNKKGGSKNIDEQIDDER